MESAVAGLVREGTKPPLNLGPSPSDTAESGEARPEYFRRPDKDTLAGMAETGIAGWDGGGCDGNGGGGSWPSSGMRALASCLDLEFDLAESRWDPDDELCLSARR